MEYLATQRLHYSQPTETFEPCDDADPTPNYENVLTD